MSEQSSYRQIMKSTSLFGGVQVFNVIISIIRSKIIAVLLGSAGMGILGLFNATTGIISSLTNFGLGTSAVKDIAAAYSTNDSSRISTIVIVFRRLVWFTGILGAIVTLLFSPWLSQFTFGNGNYTFAFICVSVTLLFGQLNIGQLVVLQGMRRLKELAMSNVIGSAIGLLVILPFYYFYRIDGIVPGLIGTVLVTLLFSWYFSRKIAIVYIPVSMHKTYTEGKNMLRMGFLISLSGLLSVGASYLVQIYISRKGGIEQVGLYSAGFSIINTYVGLIFNAMGADYYPRLSTVAHDNNLCRKTINQQAEIALLILAPILIAFLLFIDWFVVLFYSKQFIAVNTMIYWAALGMFFKTISWAIGFAFLARGTSKVFFWSELIASFYILIFNILGYKYWGLTGLGLSFMVSYLIVFIQVYIISKLEFSFFLEKALLKILMLQFALAAIGFITVKYLDEFFSYCVGGILFGISVWYSLNELDKRLDLKSILKMIK